MPTTTTPSTPTTYVYVLGELLEKFVALELVPLLWNHARHGQLRPRAQVLSQQKLEIICLRDQMRRAGPRRVAGLLLGQRRRWLRLGLCAAAGLGVAASLLLLVAVSRDYLECTDRSSRRYLEELVRLRSWRRFSENGAEMHAPSSPSFSV